MNTLSSTLKLRIVSQENYVIKIDSCVHVKPSTPQKCFLTLFHEYLKYIRLPNFIMSAY